MLFIPNKKQTCTFSFIQLQSFHLYEMSNVRHMFDYEKTAGQAFMKDRNNRLKSYEWTNTGIKLMIPDINKNMDLGNYQGEVETDQDYNKIAIEVKQIFGQSFIWITLWDCKNLININV